MRTRASLNEKKNESNSTFGIGLGYASLGPTGDYVFFNEFGKDSMSHNTRVTKADEIRRERRHASSHASSRARLPRPDFLLAAQAKKLSLGAGRRKMPPAE